MMREEVVSKFKNCEGHEIKNRILLKLEADFQRKKDKLASEFGKSFLKACQNIVMLQEKGLLGEIEYMIVTLLRSNIVKGEFDIPIIVCGSDWWLDDIQMEIGSYFGGFVFEYYKQMEYELMESRQKYLFKIIPQDIKIFMQEEIRGFLLYLERIAKYHILELTKTKEFQAIRKADRIQIQVGEYMDFMKSIYKEEMIPPDREAILGKIEGKQEEFLHFKDFRCIELCKKDLKKSNWQFSNFGESNISYSDLSYSVLVGSVFAECNMEHTDFSHSRLNEAAFVKANLKHTNFCYIEAYEGLQNQREWHTAGYYPIDFRYANLEYADFTGADIRGALFEGAILKETVFTREQLSYLNLTLQQKNVLKEVVY